MPIIDNTFTRIALRNGDLFFRHAEHGGCVTDVLDADLAKNIDSILAYWKSEAEKQILGNWEFVRVFVNVLPFSSQTIVENLIHQDKRRKALAKLSQEDKQILGLTEK